MQKNVKLPIVSSARIEIDKDLKPPVFVMSIDVNNERNIIL